MLSLFILIQNISNIAVLEKVINSSTNHTARNLFICQDILYVINNDKSSIYKIYLYMCTYVYMHIYANVRKYAYINEHAELFYEGKNKARQ